MDPRILYGLVALASAAAWALGTVLWRRIGEEVPPLSMNLGKGVIGCVYLAAALLLARAEPMSGRDALCLAASGILGIALGDTFFFLSLMHLGPGLASLMGTLVPVAVAFAAVLVLGERPSAAAWAGILLTVAGVAWVVRGRRAGGGAAAASTARGVALRLLSVVFMTAGIITAKVGVRDVPAVQGTLVRMLAGVGGVLAWGLVTGRARGWVEPFRSPRLVGKVALIVFVVVFGGFWLSLLSLKHLDASLAGALGSTSPLFVLPIAGIILGERVSFHAALGAAVAVGGVALLLVGA